MPEWNRTRVVTITEFVGFPKDVARLIAGYCMVPELLPWIDRAKLDIDMLYTNPKAFEAGWLHPEGRSFWLAGNPAAKDVILGNLNLFISKSPIWENSAVFDYLADSGHEINDMWICSNPHPRAVAMVISCEVKMDISLFNSNPGAIRWLRANPSMINKDAICGNPEAINIIQGLDEINYEYLAYNRHPWAIEQLRSHADQIVWESISSNPGIFEYRVSESLVSALTRDS